MTGSRMRMYLLHTGITAQHRALCALHAAQLQAHALRRGLERACALQQLHTQDSAAHGVAICTWVSRQAAMSKMSVKRNGHTL